MLGSDHNLVCSLWRCAWKHNLIATKFDVGELVRQTRWHSSNIGGPLCKQWNSRGFGKYSSRSQKPHAQLMHECTWLHVNI
jgi:hypothetical protein